LTASQVLQIRARPHTSAIALAAEFGVERSTVRLARNRKTWRHI
jgi:hypothetical protein